jgi:spermidine synthase
VRRRLYFEISAASLALVLSKVAYARVFSFKLYDAFAYLVVGVALLGLGLGGVLAASWRRLAERGVERVVPEACAFGAASALVSYLVAARVALNASALDYELGEVVKLGAVCVVLSLPFAAIGVVVAVVLGTHSDAVGKLYGAALLGAAAGCSVVSALIEALDAPRIVLLSGAVLALAALPLAFARRAFFGAALVLAVGLLASATFARWLPDATVDSDKGFESLRKAGLLRATRDDADLRVDVAEDPAHAGDRFLLFYDGLLGSGLRRLGSRAFDELDDDSRRLPFEVLQKRKSRVLIIGSAGAEEIVAALRFGAEHVTLIGLNAATLSLFRGAYADFTGRLHEDPRITLVAGNGRWFLEQSDEEFDLIWFVAPDSYAVTNGAASAAFVPRENYVYTAEAIGDAFRRLTEGGIVCAEFGELDIEHKPNRTLRFISTARQFYRDERIPDFQSRVLVASSQGSQPFVESTILLSRSALSGVQIDAAKRHVMRRMPHGVVRYTPGDKTRQTLIQQAALIAPDLIADWYRVQPYRLTPVRDDAPFFWQFTSFTDALGADGADARVDYQDGVGERALLALLLVAAAVGVFCSLAPLLVMRDRWRAIPHKASAAAYFAAVGVGLSFIATAVMEQLTLLLGLPTRSLTVTLFGLLLTTGGGALLSSRYTAAPHRAAGLLLAALLALLSLWHLAEPRAVHSFLERALSLRIFVALILVAPLGLCLGGFVPTGLGAIARVSEHGRELVAWAWAVSAMSSVVGSVLALLVAMLAGFKFLLVASPVIFGAGALALLRVQPAPS